MDVRLSTEQQALREPAALSLTSLALTPSEKSAMRHGRKSWTQPLRNRDGETFASEIMMVDRWPQG